MLFARDGSRKMGEGLWLQELVDGHVNEIGKFNHGFNAYIMRRAFDLGNMRLRDARLCLNIALAKTCVLSGCAEVFRKALALQPAFYEPIACVTSPASRFILTRNLCGFNIT
jgi:hypothetical protein